MIIVAQTKDIGVHVDWTNEPWENIDAKWARHNVDIIALHSQISVSLPSIIDKNEERAVVAFTITHEDGRAEQIHINIWRDTGIDIHLP